MTDLLEDASLYHRIGEGVSDAFVFADAEGRIRLWSPGAARMFGYSRDEALGQSLDLIVPAAMQERHWEGYRRVMRTGQTHYAEELLAVPARCKDGRRISIEFTIAMVRDEQGAVLGAGAVIREVTERWQKEKALKARLAELEARQ
jgi:PAS domain S-box-containing protein